VFVEQWDRYIIGAVKVKDKKAARDLIEKLRQKIQAAPPSQKGADG